MAHPYSEYNSAVKSHQLPIRKDVGKSQKHFASEKKPNSRGYILHDSIYVPFWKMQKYRHRIQSSDCQRLEMGGVLNTQGHEGPRGCGVLHVMTVMVATEPYTF